MNLRYLYFWIYEYVTGCDFFLGSKAGYVSILMRIIEALKQVGDMRFFLLSKSKLSKFINYGCVLRPQKGKNRILKKAQKRPK